MTTITVLAGARTIGGTQIVVEEDGARLLFDCGLAYDPAGNPFAHVRRRPWRLVADLLALRLVPAIPGLYAPEILAEVPAHAPWDVPPSGGPLAVALSHSHLDHTHLVGFVDPAVAVYASGPTTRIVPVLGAVGHSLGVTRRPLTAVAPGERFAIGPMQVRLLPVDHDVCGASGMLIETSAGIIAYSGDVRLHGPNPALTLSFAQAAREAGARLLILEGTRLRPDPEPGAEAEPAPEWAEADVAPAMLRALREAPGALGVILLTPENGERVEALAQAACAAGRLLLLDPEGWALVSAALGRPPAPPLGVYISTSMARALDTEDALAPVLKEAVAAAPRLVRPAEVAADPASFLLRVTFEDFADLLELLPGERDGVLIAAGATPLGRFDPAWTHMEWWARRLGLRVVENNASGHATPPDLAAIAAQSGAPVVMAIHSRYPELLPVPPERLLLPELGRPYDLSRLGEV